jgi:hypothetical protein
MFKRFIVVVLAIAISTAANEKVISLFGSSVADGAFCKGNCSGKAAATTSVVGGCYQSRLRMYQQRERGEGRSVFNNCHGGDSTIKLLARYNQMLSCNPGYVFIGLSLANEGIRGSDPQKIYDQYKTNMRTLVNQSRSHGIEPIIGLCYPNSDYTPTQYNYIKQMNLLLNTWDVPTANFLGAIDDGKGRWVNGYHINSGHPNDLGSTEMYYSIVPSIFDAIKAGKPPAPKRADGTQYTTVNATADGAQDPSTYASAFVYTPSPNQTIHAFAIQFGFRTAGDSTLAVVQLKNGGIVKVAVNSGQVSYISSEIPHPTPVPPPAPTPHGPSPCGTWCEDHGDAPDTCACGVCGSFGGCSWSCNPADTTKSHPLIKCPNATAQEQQAAFGRQLGTGGSGWHEVVVSHFYLNQTTNVYVDGELTSQHAEQLEPAQFSLGAGEATATANTSAVDYQDLMIFRAALNTDEVLSMRSTPKTLLQASLEIYAPLAAADPLKNEAQSLSEISQGTAAF